MSFIPAWAIPFYETSVLTHTFLFTALALFVFILIVMIAPWRWIPLQTHREYGRLFICLAIGIFLLRASMWSYTAFNAGQKVRIGSFRIKGVTYAQDTARAWRFTAMNRLIETHWLYPINPGVIAQSPPRVYDRQPIDDGLQQAETFRRSLFVPNGAGPNRARVTAQAIVEFQRASEAKLRGHVSLERFKLDEYDLVERMKPSRFEIDGIEAFSDFEGRWYGLWDTMPVDHHWRPVEFFEPPRPIPGKEKLSLRSLQYAWIGDGFGWNAAVSTQQNVKAGEQDGGAGEQDDGAGEQVGEAGDVILGIVYHVENKDPTKVVRTRPHLGIQLDPGQLIWITAGEIFLEEKLGSVRYGDERYAITGFKYTIQESKLKPKGQAFQAVYTRKPEPRQPFFPFTPNWPQ